MEVCRRKKERREHEEKADYWLFYITHSLTHPLSMTILSHTASLCLPPSLPANNKRNAQRFERYKNKARSCWEGSTECMLKRATPEPQTNKRTAFHTKNTPLTFPHLIRHKQLNILHQRIGQHTPPHSLDTPPHLSTLTTLPFVPMTLTNQRSFSLSVTHLQWHCCFPFFFSFRTREKRKEK